MSYLDHPVFICGHRKSGTTALLCLFDSHPQLLTFPIDSAFFYNAYPACEELGLEATIERVIAKTFRENLAEELEHVGNPALLDVGAIADSYAAMARTGGHTPAGHLLAMIGAYAEHCGQSPERWSGWVEKTTSSEIYAGRIASWFPNARFIHLVRDPRDNWASLKSGWDARYKNQEEAPRDLLQSLLDRGGLGLRMALLNRAALGDDRYRVLRFEDLTNDPQRELELLCAFLGISYDRVLETPSLDGAHWPGNNFDGLTFGGLSNVNVGRWRERAGREEVALIEAHLGEVMTAFNYLPECSVAERIEAASQHYVWQNAARRAPEGVTA